MKIRIAALLATCLFAPITVQAGVDHDRGNQEKTEEEKQKEQKKADKARKNDAIRDFLKQKDKNKDSSVSRDEYLAGEEDQEAAGEKFDEFNKNGDRSLTKKEIGELLGF